jgi:ribosome maturation protein Sdo1
VRIENAFEQMKVNVDPDVPAERQVQEKVLKKLPEILPIKRSEMSGTLSSAFSRPDQKQNDDLAARVSASCC